MAYSVESLNCIVSEIKECVERVTETAKCTEAPRTDVVERLMSMLPHFPAFSVDDARQKALVPEVEGYAVSLWNAAVAGKTGKKLDADTNAKNALSTFVARASAVRHVACSLMFLCHGVESKEDQLKKQIMMALKATQAWLDCERPATCETLLAHTGECLEKLRSLVGTKDREDVSADEGREMEVLSLDKDNFKWLCYRAEVAVMQGDHEKALQPAQEAKAMLDRLPNELVFLTMLLYNFGVEDYRRRRFEESTVWLKESYDLGNGRAGVNLKNQARTLRLLANAYLEWDSEQHWQKALNAIAMANAEHSHPAGQCLKLRILLIAKEGEDKLTAGLRDVLHHPELTIDVGLSTIELLLEYDRKSLAFSGVSELRDLFKDAPEANVLWGRHLELLLRHGLVQEAQGLLSQGGDVVRSLAEGTKKRIHALIWERAAEKFEANDIVAALSWYNISDALFDCEAQTDSNQAKLHRNLASCYLELQQTDKALVMAEKATKIDPDSAHSQYLLFKIALLQGRDEQAISALETMCSCIEGEAAANNNESHGFICLAAQLAFQQSNRAVAVHALENLVRRSPIPQQVLTALRCLVRLKLTFISEGQQQRDEQKSLLSYLETAHKKLVLLENEDPEQVNVVEESSWFMKIAWNMALQCEETCPALLDLFTLCYKLSQLHSSEPGTLVRQKNCLLMAAATSLELAREVTNKDQISPYLTVAVDNIQICHSVCKLIDENRLSNTGVQSKDPTTPVLLVLYEFEARARLGDGDLEKVLEKALQLPQVEPKAFETMAALALESPRQQRSLSIRALKLAIKKHLQQQPKVDYVKCSRAFHSLVELALRGGLTSAPANREEAWGYCMDALDIIENKATNNYPEMEILWLMTKCWNSGVQLYSAGVEADAMQWCDLGVKLMNNLTAQKSSYETQMLAACEEMKLKTGVAQK